MDTLAIGIVLYNPSDLSINRLKSFISTGLNLIVLDNSPKSNTDLAKLENNNFHYYSSGINLGLSKGLNYLCEISLSKKCKHLLFFDQDTIFGVETISFVRETIKHLLNDSLGNKIIAFNFRDRLVNNLNRKKVFTFNEVLYNEVYFIINSGTLFNLNLYHTYPWFNDKIFVDGVDYEFSFRARIKGFKLVELANVPGINHTLEQGDLSFEIFGRKVYLRNYPRKRKIEFIKTHINLIIQSMKNMHFRGSFFLFRALLIFALSQIFSYFLIKKND